MKTTHCYLIFCFLFCTSKLFPQTVQQGVTLAYNERNQKTPLGGVQIVIRDAGSTVSDVSGKFTLKFSTLKAGDRVIYRVIKKNGYELFNTDALAQWNISKDNKPFTIILCQSSKLKAIKDNYNRVASKSYEAQYRKEQQSIEAKLKEGKIKEIEYKQKILEIEDRYYRQLDNLDNYIERFARIDLSELDDKEKAIIECVQRGEIEKAITLYESLDYIGQYKKETRKIQDLAIAEAKINSLKEELTSDRNNLLAAINKQILVYNLAGGEKNFNKAYTLLHEVVKADTTNCSSTLMLADFLFDFKNYEEAVTTYQLALRHTNLYEQQMQIVFKIGIIVAESLYNLPIDATRKETNSAYILASNLFEVAGECYNKLSNPQKESFIDFKIKLMQEMANLHISSGNYVEATNLTKWIIDYYKNNDTLIDELELNRCNVRMAQIHVLHNEYAKADSILKITIPKIEELYKQDIQKYGKNYIAAIRVKAYCLNHEGNENDYLTYKQQEIDILKELVERNKQKYVYELGMTYRDLGLFYINNNDTLRADSSFHKAYDAINMDQHFSAISNGILRYNVVREIIVFLKDIKQYDRAISLINKEKPLELFHEMYEPFEGEIYFEKGDVKKALFVYDDLVSRFDHFYENHTGFELENKLKQHLSSLSHDKMSNLSDEHLAIALLYHYGNKLLEDDLPNEAVDYLSKLYKYSHLLNRETLNDIYSKLGNIYLSDKNKYAMIDMKECFEIGTTFLLFDVYLDLDKAYFFLKKSYDLGCIDALNNLAWCLYLKGNYSDALPYAEQAVKAFPDVPNAYDTLASIHYSLNHIEEALSAYSMCLAIYEKKGDEEGITKTKKKIQDCISKISKASQ